MFSYDNVRGALLFGATRGTEAQLAGVISQLRSAWPAKQLAINVCSETSFWGLQNTDLPPGPMPFSVENRANLRRFLNITAELGVMVRMNIFCTTRDNQEWMDNNWKRYVRQVVLIAEDYDHTLLSPANEPYHPASWLRSNNKVKKVRDYMRTAGWQGPIGTDDGLGSRRNGAGDLVNVKYAYGHLGFTPDFHPFRSPEPKGRDFDRLVAVNGLPLVISEPIAYGAQAHCCTLNKERILRFFRRAERRGIVVFFHGRTNLRWPDATLTWIPIP